MAERKKAIPDAVVTGVYVSEKKNGTAVGIEHVHIGEGVELHSLDVVADSDDAKDDIFDQFDGVHGADLDEVEGFGQGSRSSFGFSAKKWNSPWNPQGPKQNWATRSLEDDLDVS